MSSCYSQEGLSTSRAGFAKHFFWTLPYALGLYLRRPQCTYMGVMPAPYPFNLLGYRRNRLHHSKFLIHFTLHFLHHARSRLPSHSPRHEHYWLVSRRQKNSPKAFCITRPGERPLRAIRSTTSECYAQCSGQVGERYIGLLEQRQNDVKVGRPRRFG
ncbi:hypothetical protein BDW02DRAFT_40193 [Decorospora gaudefroyi]|uniref:Uncharacterized protein n=1 Tax=Decorospora gaudefroyi TaxID=184978 RepID=A0A6A5K3M2_9PLEO|nr:hypothetical protein BDW02DRAFT_40193 [Decorospora gaudefroyi]